MLARLIAIVVLCACGGCFHGLDGSLIEPLEDGGLPDVEIADRSVPRPDASTNDLAQADGFDAGDVLDDATLDGTGSAR